MLVLVISARGENRVAAKSPLYASQSADWLWARPGDASKPSMDATENRYVRRIGFSDQSTLSRGSEQPVWNISRIINAAVEIQLYLDFKWGRGSNRRPSEPSANELADGQQSSVVLSAVSISILPVPPYNTGQWTILLNLMMKL
jgi:hypothetical protein